jgi:hypothetical protein
MSDTLVLPIASALLQCLCDQLALIEAPVCQCSLRPGVAPPPADSCCSCGGGSGQASVQVTSIAPLSIGKFPNLGVSGTLDNCSSFEWAAELTMVVYRCVSVADGEGFPSADELTADATRILNDAQAMRRAMLCCAWRDDELGDARPIVPGRWTPLSPQGGCAGGQMPVTVLLGSECCP